MQKMMTTDDEIMMVFLPLSRRTYHMRHHAFQKELNLWLDTHRNQTLPAALQEHAAICGKCRSYMDQLLSLDNAHRPRPPAIGFFP